MKLLFMHLSDLHLSKNDDINEDAIAGIAQTLSSQNIGSINHVLVLVTGDIANAGKKNEYDAFHSFKELLLSALAENLPDNTTLHIYISFQEITISIMIIFQTLMTDSIMKLF